MEWLALHKITLLVVMLCQEPIYKGKQRIGIRINDDCSETVVKTGFDLCDLNAEPVHICHHRIKKYFTIKKEGGE